jgi:hypothetical protein
MSLEETIQKAVQVEMDKAMEPLAEVVLALKEQGALVARLVGALQSAGTSLLEVLMTPSPAKVARQPRAARQPKAEPKGVNPGVDGYAGAKEGDRLCALEGCGKPARSKGYCAAHYQKYHMLQKTGRLPADWVEFAPEGSVKNVTLPRGRAGAAALKKARTAA